LRRRSPLLQRLHVLPIKSKAKSWGRCCLMIFTRYPEAGRTKTRLIPLLGATGAARLQKGLTEKVVGQAKLLARQTAIDIVLYYSGGNRQKMLSWLGLPNCFAQAEGDLGKKMRRAFEQSFAAGAEAAVLIGSDIPEITSDLLRQAFSMLSAGEVVIGPSRDGGYYLIGLVADQAERLLPLLFEEMPWSTPHLFMDTMNRLAAAGCQVATLPSLSDIDHPEDLLIAKESGLL